MVDERGRSEILSSILKEPPDTDDDEEIKLLQDGVQIPRLFLSQMPSDLIEMFDNDRGTLVLTKRLIEEGFLAENNNLIMGVDSGELNILFFAGFHDAEKFDIVLNLVDNMNEPISSRVQFVIESLKQFGQFYHCRKYVSRPWDKDSSISFWKCLFFSWIRINKNYEGSFDELLVENQESFSLFLENELGNSLQRKSSIKASLLAKIEVSRALKTGHLEDLNSLNCSRYANLTHFQWGSTLQTN